MECNEILSDFSDDYYCSLSSSEDDEAHLGYAAGDDENPVGPISTRPISSYAVGADESAGAVMEPSEAGLAGPSETVGISAGAGGGEAQPVSRLLEVAQSPTLHGNKKVINVQRNRIGVMSSLSPGGTRVGILYAGPAPRQTYIRTSDIRVCPLGGNADLRRSIGGGAEGARNRALKSSIWLSSHGLSYSPITSPTECLYRSMTGYSALVAWMTLGGDTRPIQPSRQNATVSVVDSKWVCTCNVYGASGVCAHVIAQHLRNPPDGSNMTSAPEADFDVPLARIHASAALAPDHDQLQRALDIGQTERQGLSGLLKASTCFRGPLAMREGAGILPAGSAVGAAQHVTSLLQQHAHMLTPQELSRVTQCLNETAAMLPPITSPPVEGSVEGTPSNQQCGAGNRQRLLMSPEERAPSSSDRRRLGDLTTKTLFSKERRRNRRSRVGSESESESGDGGDAGATGGPVAPLQPIGRTRKARKKEGLRGN